MICLSYRSSRKKTVTDTKFLNILPRIRKAYTLLKKQRSIRHWADLKKSGYVVSYEGSKTQGPPRTYFKLTNFGRKYLAEKKEEWEAAKKLVDTFFAL